MTKSETIAKESGDFKKDLSINKFRLDEECLSHSSRYAYYAEAQAAAKVNVSMAKDKLELVESEASLRIRRKFADEGQKVTESVIACTLAMDSEVVKAKNALREAEKVLAGMSVAVSAMETRRSELDNLVKLYCAGYFSTPSAGGVKSGVNNAVENSIRNKLNDKE